MLIITIIGAGELGQGIKSLWNQSERRADFDIEMWDIVPGKVDDQKPLATIIPKSDYVFLCVPTSSLAQLLRDIRLLLKPNSRIFSLSKGVDRENGLMVHEILQNNLPDEVAYSLMSGPMLAEELVVRPGGGDSKIDGEGAEGIGAATVSIESDDENILLGKLFDRVNLLIEYKDDTPGIAACGVMKNIYALGLGMLAGVSSAQNLRGIYVRQAVIEMGKICEYLGGASSTSLSYCGIADLLATGSTTKSSNYRFGVSFSAKNSKQERDTFSQQQKQPEGLIALPFMNKRLGDNTENLLFFSRIRDIILFGEQVSILKSI